jgi:hypothetical protein
MAASDAFLLPQVLLLQAFRVKSGPSRGVVHADTYSRIGDDASSFIEYSIEPPSPRSDPKQGPSSVVEVTVAMCLIWAGRAFDDMVNGKPRKQVLRSTARELELILILLQSAKGCPVTPGGRATTATAPRRVVGMSA